MTSGDRTNFPKLLHNREGEIYGIDIAPKSPCPLATMQIIKHADH
jgi:hypothetical protein